MEEAVERIKKIVADYRPGKKGNDEKTMRALLSAIGGCRKYIEEHSQDDRGCAQRIVRDLHEVLSALPSFQNLVPDKSELNKLHTRKLAESHLDLIQQHAKSIVKEHDQEKLQSIRDWVAAHPVFGPLRALLKGPLPKPAYVLLFQRNNSGELVLMTNASEDGRVFTRMRPQEFRDDSHLHKAYQRAAIAGAAVVAEKELLGVFGDVPPPTDSKDQLQALLSVSSEAAGRPARQFVETHEVLGALHDLARQRKLPKESYVLLFEVVDDDEAANDGGSDDDSVEAGSEEDADQVQPAAEVLEAPAAEAAESPVAEAAESPVAETAEIVETPATEPEAEPDTPPEIESVAMEPESVTEEASIDEQVTEAPAENSSAVSENVPPPGQLKILVRKTSDGKVLSRFWPQDFAIRHKLFDEFRERKPIVGAAVIREKELLFVFGHVPQPAGSQSPIEALLDVSWQAVEKPYVDFVNEHEVLKGLYELSHGGMARRDVSVVLFSLGDGGRLELMQLGSRGRHQSARVPLVQFQNAKALHDRFTNRMPVGASVLSEDTRERESRHGFRRPDNRRDERDNRPPREEKSAGGRSSTATINKKPVVLAAFGRTPLKVNMLATPDTFRRLGLDIE